MPHLRIPVSLILILGLFFFTNMHFIEYLCPNVMTFFLCYLLLVAFKLIILGSLYILIWIFLILNFFLPIVIEV